MRFYAALSFLTVFPVQLRRPLTAQEMGGSLPYFPLVGLFIGAALAGVSLVLNLLLSPAIANAFVLVALVLTTGALHLDGFADTLDGLGGHRTVEERHAVMRDSRLGAFGVIGLVLLLLGKYATLGSIPPALMTATLMVMPVAGRWAMVWAVVAFPYARPSGMGEAFKAHGKRRHLAAATVFALALATGAAWLAEIDAFYLAGPALLLFVFLVALFTGRFLTVRFDGLTGDGYGFINEVAEMGVLLLVSLAFWNGWIG